MINSWLANETTANFWIGGINVVGSENHLHLNIYTVVIIIISLSVPYTAGLGEAGTD